MMTSGRVRRALGATAVIPLESIPGSRTRFKHAAGENCAAKVIKTAQLIAPARERMELRA
jgi:hypothetical protein